MSHAVLAIVAIIATAVSGIPINDLFENSPVFLEHQNAIMANPNNIKFFLYTKSNPKTAQEILNNTASLDKSNWDVNAPVKVFAHGFTEAYTIGSSLAIRKAYIENYPSNVNVILVNWASLAAAPWYDVAAAGTKLVGQKTAYLISFLVANGYTTKDKLHLIGFSLGAHVAGFAGKDFQKITGETVARVTGLDAAYPRFENKGPEGRLDQTDADFVDVVHTSSGILLQGELGFVRPLGHIDYYPNKGKNQPGCALVDVAAGVCSHNRAWNLYVESIKENNFSACKCPLDAWDDKFKTCDCEALGTVKLGEFGPNTLERGIAYLTTKGKSPFAEV